MAFQRIVERRFPDGSTRLAYPFHVSLEGLESKVMFRDDEDYGVFFKYIFLCARRKNVIVITYIVMSNHAHIAILATDIAAAKGYKNELKRTYSLYFSLKHKERKLLRGTDTFVEYLDSDWYVRNTLAYIPRNAFDAGSLVEEYRWSGYRAAFRKEERHQHRPVKLLTCRERFLTFHSRDSMRAANWEVDADGEIDPISACDTAYLEDAFNHDPAFYLRVIGTVNSAEMKQKLVSNHLHLQRDADFFKTLNDLSQSWFQRNLPELTIEKKTRLITYVNHAYRTTVPQLARCFGLTREKVSMILNAAIPTHAK